MTTEFSTVSVVSTETSILAALSSSMIMGGNILMIKGSLPSKESSVNYLYVKALLNTLIYVISSLSVSGSV